MEGDRASKAVAGYVMYDPGPGWHEVRECLTLEDGRWFNQALLLSCDPSLEALCPDPVGGWSRRCIRHGLSPSPMHGQLPAISRASTTTVRAARRYCWASVVSLRRTCENAAGGPIGRPDCLGD